MTTFLWIILFIVFGVFIYVLIKENEKNKSINQLVKSGFNPTMTKHQIWVRHRKIMRHAMGGSLIIPLIYIIIVIAIILIGLNGE